MSTRDVRQGSSADDLRTIGDFHSGALKFPDGIGDIIGLEIHSAASIFDENSFETQSKGIQGRVFDTVVSGEASDAQGGYSSLLEVIV